MKNTYDLNGKHALVCGASQGIGRACAVALATAGARVTLVARNAEALAKLCEALPRTNGQNHLALALDLSHAEEAAEHVTEVAAGDAVHVLVNNSGGPPPGPVASAEWPAFEEALRQHLASAHLLCRAVLPGMQAAGYGRIVNIISTSVKTPIPGLGVSNTVRGAVASWAKTLAGEVAAHGITVNNVLPGATDTGRLRSLFASRAEKDGITVGAVEEAWKLTIPARRFAEPEEIAAAVAFLASPDAGYITGINLPVDGGRTPSL